MKSGQLGQFILIILFSILKVLFFNKTVLTIIAPESIYIVLKCSSLPCGFLISSIK